MWQVLCAYVFRRVSVLVIVWAAMLTRLSAYDVSVSHVQYIGDVYLQCVESLNSLNLAPWWMDVRRRPDVHELIVAFLLRLFNSSMLVTWILHASFLCNNIAKYIFITFNTIYFPSHLCL